MVRREMESMAPWGGWGVLVWFGVVRCGVVICGGLEVGKGRGECVPDRNDPAIMAAVSAPRVGGSWGDIFAMKGGGGGA